MVKTGAGVQKRRLRTPLVCTTYARQYKLCQFCTFLHTLLIMTAEFMLSKRPVLRFTAALFFLKLILFRILPQRRNFARCYHRSGKRNDRLPE